MNSRHAFVLHPWGDRGFSVIDPIGNSEYIYSDREPSDELKQYCKGLPVRWTTLLL